MASYEIMSPYQWLKFKSWSMRNLILRVANNKVDFGCVGILKLMMIIPTKFWKSGGGCQEGYRNDNYHRMMKKIEKLEQLNMSTL